MPDGTGETGEVLSAARAALAATDARLADADRLLGSWLNHANENNAVGLLVVVFWMSGSGTNPTTFACGARLA